MDDIAIDTLATVTGGAITAHSAARALDVITPDQVGLQVGPVSASWNVPENPWSSMLNRVAPQPSSPAKGNFWSNAASQAIGAAR